MHKALSMTRSLVRRAHLLAARRRPDSAPRALGTARLSVRFGCCRPGCRGAGSRAECIPAECRLSAGAAAPAASAARPGAAAWASPGRCLFMCPGGVAGRALARRGCQRLLSMQSTVCRRGRNGGQTIAHGSARIVIRAKIRGLRVETQLHSRVDSSSIAQLGIWRLDRSRASSLITSCIGGQKSQPSRCFALAATASHPDDSIRSRAVLWR